MICVGLVGARPYTVNLKDVPTGMFVGSAVILHTLILPGMERLKNLTVVCALAWPAVTRPTFA